MARFRPILADSGPDPVNFAPILANSGQLWPNSGQHTHRFRAKLGRSCSPRIRLSLGKIDRNQSPTFGTIWGCQLSLVVALRRSTIGAHNSDSDGHSRVSGVVFREAAGFGASRDALDRLPHEHRARYTTLSEQSSERYFRGRRSVATPLLDLGRSVARPLESWPAERSQCPATFGRSRPQLERSDSGQNTLGGPLAMHADIAQLLRDSSRPHRLATPYGATPEGVRGGELCGLGHRWRGAGATAESALAARLVVQDGCGEGDDGRQNQVTPESRRLRSRRGVPA